MKRPRATYRLDPDASSFVIENYNWAEPFSNFLPGIAGKWGIPLWVYYVSRAQAVCSAGVRDKDGQILEFYSFNKALMRVAREGFRTFIKLDGGPAYEPFRKTDRPGILQTMMVSSAELRLRERNRPLRLEIEVAYFTLPNFPVAALCRDVRIRNLADEERRIEWVDGAPRVLPYGLDQARIKSIPRHIEGMMGVGSFAGIPLFRLKQTADDVERVARVTGGHFYVAPGVSLGKGVVVDPEAVFGEAMNFDRPWHFDASGLRGVLAFPQYGDNKTPSAFAARADRLAPGGEARQVSLIGHVGRDEDLRGLLAALRKKGFVEDKRAENGRVVEEIADRCFTVSSSPHFDAYARQDFLDNVVRGGMPLVLETARGKSVLPIYSRQNGDLERDYHHFVLDPTYLSQGTGHYRSVLQNRRTDTWFFPEVEDANLRAFLNLIQLDGYNPLEVKGVAYRVENAAGLRKWLRANVGSPVLRAGLLEKMGAAFTPGELLLSLERAGGLAAADRERTLRGILAFCREGEIGGLHEGFWVDHWHYNIDLLEIVLAVYPERAGEFLLGGARLTFFDDPDVILPRDRKTVDAGGNIRCYGAVVRDPEKERLIGARRTDAYKARTRHGKGSVYKTSVVVKLLCIVANRLATLDPAGTGVEMEAGKPGWNDSMNGLPGLFGSGLSETIELRRALRFLLEALERLDAAEAKPVPVYEELVRLMRRLIGLMRRRLSPHERAAFRYWDEANTLKELYRERTKFGVSGREVSMPLAEIRDFLSEGKALLDAVFTGPARRKVLSRDGVPYTYFVNEVVRSRPLGRESRLGYPLVRPLAFRQRPVRLFLEGPVHWMKDRPHEAKKVYEAVRRSKVYDRKLRMYKSCEDMTGESPELGRAVGAYPRGWIENESIYLHMEYKYLLEILRSGLCEEFWRDARTALIPFMDPAAYGRSTLEGASFIVSSAYADPRLHGRAFQPRLSGITCEFLHIWILAAAGPRPLREGAGGRLELALEPRLPGWLFTRRRCVRRWHDAQDGWLDVEVPANAFAFKLLGRTLVVYHNPARKPTYGPKGARPASYRLEYRDGRTVEAAGAVASPHAEAVREGAVRRIDVTLR
ncbi:MAG: cellobiose phosphorylase [Elusimicrobiota bacterium]